MKRRHRLLPVFLTVFFAIGAIAAASALADAPSWTFGGAGAFLPTGTTKNLESRNQQTPTVVEPQLEVPALNATIKCKKSTGTGKIVGNAAANGKGLDEKVQITFKECSVPLFPKCTVRSVKPLPAEPAGTIRTYPLKSELVWLAATGNEDGDLLSPEVNAETNPKGYFTVLVFEGSGCTLPEAELPVTGGVIGKVEPKAGEPEQTLGRLNFPSPAITKYWEGGTTRTERNFGTTPAPNGLKLGTNPAIYKSIEEIELEKEAGAHPKFGTKGH